LPRTPSLCFGKPFRISWWLVLGSSLVAALTRSGIRSLLPQDHVGQRVFRPAGKALEAFRREEWQTLSPTHWRDDGGWTTCKNRLRLMGGAERHRFDATRFLHLREFCPLRFVASNWLLRCVFVARPKSDKDRNSRTTNLRVVLALCATT
jgi:hypothetical protein